MRRILHCLGTWGEREPFLSLASVVCAGERRRIESDALTKQQDNLQKVTGMTLDDLANPTWPSEVFWTQQ